MKWNWSKFVETLIRVIIAAVSGALGGSIV